MAIDEKRELPSGRKEVERSREGMNAVNQGGRQSGGKRRSVVTARSMTGSRTSGNATRIQLRIEPLETRRLLAGLNVSVFLDQNASQEFEQAADDVGAGRILFLDQDRSGTFTAGEPLAIAGSDGVASFSNLEAGDYWVGLVPHSAQRQVTSTGVAPSTIQISHETGTFLLSSATQDRVWLLDSEGRLFEPDNPSEPTLFDGVPVFAETTGPDTWLLVFSQGNSDYRFINFDASTGSSSELNVTGLPYGATVEDVAVGSESIAVILAGDSGRSIAFAERSTAPAFGSNTPSTDTQISGHYEREEFYSAGGPTQVVTLWDAAQASPVYTTDLSRDVSQLHLAVDGSLVVGTSANNDMDATTLVLTSGKDSLETSAILADAKGPFQFSPNGQQLFTGSSTGAIIAWDRTTWQLRGRIESPNSIAATQIHVDIHSETALLLDFTGIHSADLAVAQPQYVEITNNELQTLTLGVRRSGENEAPKGSVPTRVLNEDSSDLGNLADTAELNDSDGDLLYYSVLTRPNAGDLTLTPQGRWQYSPSNDFSGSDVAELLIHDGVDSTVVTVEIDVLPVNDPPVSLQAQLGELPEGDVDGEVGFISIVDVDRDAAYDVTTSDERFSVRDGRIFASGSFDYETESQIVFDVYAVDATNPDIMISAPATVTLADINEPPTGIELDNSDIAENLAGGTVGSYTVLDPDSNAAYSVTVDDDRFEIADGQLKLRDGDQLDFETESTVTLTITAVDQSNESNRLQQTVTITVGDRNDNPRTITLNRTKVDTAIAGSEVGLLAVEDPDNDPYVFAVSDDRFEVIDSLLKLKGDQEIDAHEEPSVALTITANSRSGDSLEREFTLEVVDYPPYHNPDNPPDVNGDGQVTPLDVLLLINRINAGGGGPLQHPSTGNGEPVGENFPDVNGDNQLTPVDVLMIVNYLNSRRGEGESSGYVPGKLACVADSHSERSQNMTAAFPIEFNHDFDVEDENTYQQRIQAELEEIVEALSQDAL